MLTLPNKHNTLFAQIRPFFSKQIWKLAVVLLVGAFLALVAHSYSHTAYHGLEPGATFSELPSRAESGSRCNLVQSGTQSRFVPFAAHHFSFRLPVVIGIDETIERDMARRSRTMVSTSRI